MFRLHRNKSDKSGEKIDFKFSNFQILQVPKGWDKLLVSIVSVETGKTVTKSSKALARNGKCVWTESLSESIWISLDDASKKQMEPNLFKLVVSMGSARSSILGEASINLTTYISSKSPVPVSLPLKKNTQGTILQVKIQCLNPKTIVRDEQLQEAASPLEDMNADYNETDNKSDISDNSYAKSFGSSSSNHLGSALHPGEVGSRNASFSASGSRISFDSAEGSVDKTTFSPRHDFSGDLYDPIGIQDSPSLQNGGTHGAVPVGDHSRSNQTSFNSRFTTSGSNLHSQRQELGHSPSTLAMSSLGNARSSKELLEAAEDTIEELRSEAKMWERNARKLMHDLELVRKESSGQSRHQADLDMELSAACTERDSLKKEIEQLKELLEESKTKNMASEHSISQAEGISHIQKELESEIKFQKESNTNLAVQLEKTQESNIELVSILQELEETIEKQRLEIDAISAERVNLSTEENCEHGNEDMECPNENQDIQKLVEAQKEFQATVCLLEEKLEDKNKELELEQNSRRTLLELEADYKYKLSAREVEMMKLEAKLSDLLNTQGSNDNRCSRGIDSDLIKEIETLKEKVQELENDCNELTEENLELIFKLQESKKDLRPGGDSFSSSSSKLHSTVSATGSEPEVDSLRSQIDQLKQELKNKEMLREGVSSTDLEVQLIDLQNMIGCLEVQLHSSQDNACHLEDELRDRQVELEERRMEIISLKQELNVHREKETVTELQHTLPETRFEKAEAHNCEEMSELFPELYKQLQLALAHVKRPWRDGSSHVNTVCETDQNHLVSSDCTDVTCQKLKPEDILNSLSELNELLEAKIFECETVFQHIESELRERNENVTEAQEKLEGYGPKENVSHLNHVFEDLNSKLEAKVADLNKDLLAKGTEVKELEASLLLKEEEIEILRHSQQELRAQVSDLQEEKAQLEENLEVVSRGSSISSKCLDDVKNDMMALTSNLDSHVSANKMLENKSSELESGKRDLELRLLELEEENVQLSERLSAMEAQLRYLTDEKEFSRLELESSKSLSMDLRDEITRLENEIEIQKVDLKHKLQEMQKRWSDAQEECEYMQRANPKLQATAESLIEECDSMQKLNGELRKQKLELHEHCTYLEAELRESRNKFSDCSKKIEILESKFFSMQEGFTAKEEILTSELNNLLHENKEHKEKLILEESLLSQMYLEKIIEVESLQREVAHLTEQISATHDEREKIASNAVREVSTLRADKAKLETSVHEAQAKVKLSETKLQTLQTESETKLQGLISALASGRQNQELMMADYEKLQKLLDEVKASEDRFKGTVNGLELRLSTSEYGRQQLVEEISYLTVQLQKIGQLQDEIVALKNSLNEVKFEKSKMEASLQLLSGDCEELKAEKVSFVEKISSMQKAVSALEDCTRCRVALEEKLLRLQGDLSAKEALCAQDAELKNELSRIKRANSQFQRKIQCLEDEKDECLKRVQVLEKELKLKKEEEQTQSMSTSKDFPSPKSSKELRHSEKEMERNINAVNGRLSTKIEEKVQYQEEVNGNDNHRDCNGGTGVDIVMKIHLLENELAEALEANNMYKAQLKKSLADGQNGYANGPKKLSSVEAELKDIRERYFHMSLKFAEVEAEREDLVMQIKTLRNGRRWFS